MTAEEFRQRFGIEPRQDDLERVTCEKAGDVGHYWCGVCTEHQQPRFLCGCCALALRDIEASAVGASSVPTKAQ